MDSEYQRLNEEPASVDSSAVNIAIPEKEFDDLRPEPTTNGYEPFFESFRQLLLAVAAGIVFGAGLGLIVVAYTDAGHSYVADFTKYDGFICGPSSKLSSIDSNDVETCAQECLLDENCAAFEFSSDLELCFFESYCSEAQIKHDKSIDLYLRTPLPQVKDFTSYPQKSCEAVGDLGKSDVLSLQSCADLCQIIDSCVSFEFGDGCELSSFCTESLSPNLKSSLYVYQNRVATKSQIPQTEADQVANEAHRVANEAAHQLTNEAHRVANEAAHQVANEEGHQVEGRRVVRHGEAHRVAKESHHKADRVVKKLPMRQHEEPSWTRRADVSHSRRQPPAEWTFHSELATFGEAERHCNIEGRHLLTLDEQNPTTYSPSNNPFWIGLKRREHGETAWIDGSQVDDMIVPREASTFRPGHQCAIATEYLSGRHHWRFVDCSSRAQFVCGPVVNSP